jgi:type IV secretory pathway TraG/TraD family ATPase VirD4
MILSRDIKKLIERINENDESESRMASIESGLDSKNQTAGVVSTLQGMLAPLNTPEINWVLSGNDLTLDLNNIDEKKFLSVANTPDLAPILGPVISLIFSAAFQNMNNTGRHPSVAVIDELPTIYIPKLEVIPATGRENKICPVFGVQDYAQLEDNYTEKKAEVIASVLNNQFYGRTTNPKTAKRISDLFGPEDKTIITRSHSKPELTVFDVLSPSKSHATNTRSENIQQRPRVQPQEVLNLATGEFFGTLVGSWKNEFKMQLQEQKYPSQPIPVLYEEATPEAIKENSKRIKEEALAIIDGSL